MGQLRDVLLNKPNFSNFILSRSNKFTAAPGPLYPILVEECLPGDSFSIRFDNDVKTYPLLSPLLGSFRQQVALFFIPTRLYVQAMDQNRLMFDPSTVLYPTFQANAKKVDSDAVDGLKYRCKKSSIMDHLGYFAGSLEVVTSSTVPVLGRNFNAIPLIGYYDIFRNYFANTQEPDFYYMGVISESAQLIPTYQKLPLSGLDTLIDYFVKNEGGLFSTGWAKSFNDPEDAPYSPDGASFVTPLGGLVVRTYRPDRLNAWLSNGTYDNMVTKARVSTAGDSFTINQLRFANHLMQYYERGIVAGGRYDDWVQGQFGVRTDKKLCIPELLGVVSSQINFDEIVATAASVYGSSESPLGDLGGRGYGSMNSRTFRFTCSENGYLMAIYTITPNVSYGSGVRDYLEKTRYSDVYTPVMQRIGFQPLMLSRFTLDPKTISNGTSSHLSSTAGFSQAVGYQPAWTEYMTALNEVHGDFNPQVGDLAYWVMSRKYVSYPSNIATADSTILGPTSYILPDQYNYPFTNTSVTAENFLVSFAIDIQARRAIGKSVMPTLA
nr:MAG: major capsid protein [Microviridae sp.]UCS96114.1 MAG: major capsid protein [Microviridae sp.]